MYFLKSDINQFEHLITLLVFVGILMMLSGHEEKIIMSQKYIDNYLGLQQNKNNENTCNQTSLLFNHNSIKDILTTSKEWIIKDYKSSQCRKWIKWINNKRRIIFSS